jgi:putative membrane protein
MRGAVGRRAEARGDPVNVFANVLVGVVAALHLYTLVLEMFLWQGPRGRALHGLDADGARVTAPLAANQGLYNGFLTAGLIWGLIADNPVGFQVTVFFLSCVMLAGVYGAATANRKILLVQFAPAAVALAAVLVAH